MIVVGERTYVIHRGAPFDDWPVGVAVKVEFGGRVQMHAIKYADAGLLNETDVQLLALAMPELAKWEKGARIWAATQAAVKESKVK